MDADYDVNVLAVQGVVGYDLGPVRMSRTLRTGSFIPEAGLRYLRVNQKSYTDSAEQSVSSASATTLTGLAGMHYTIDTKLGNNVVFYPDLKGMVTYDIVQDELSPTVRLSNNAMYQATEKRMDKLGAELGAELGLRFGRAVNLSLNYLGTLKKDYLDHTGTVRLKVSF